MSIDPRTAFSMGIACGVMFWVKPVGTDFKFGLFDNLFAVDDIHQIYLELLYKRLLMFQYSYTFYTDYFLTIVDTIVKL